MTHSHILKAILTALTVAAVGVFGSVSAYAESDISTTAPFIATETSDETATTTSATTVPAASTTTAETSTPAETTAPETAPETTTTELENPYDTGLLSDDELYAFLQGWLYDPEDFDMSGSGVLVGEDIIKSDSDNESQDFVDETGNPNIVSSTEKLMYTVATRNGNRFYIIIDKTADGENVYFLNDVDFTDLAALVDTEKETLSAAEMDILNKADEEIANNSSEKGENSGNSDDDTQQSALESGEQSESTNETGKRDYTMYIVIAVAFVVGIVIMWYKKVGPGKQKKIAYKEPDDDDEEYVEDESEQENTDSKGEDDNENYE